jgi:hypothetical protein
MRLKVGVALAECCDIPMTERPWINAMEQREDTDVVNPRADNDDTICSTWVSPRCRFRTILGLKVARGSAAVNSQRVNAQARSNIRYQRVPARFDFDTSPLLKVLDEGRPRKNVSSSGPNRTLRRLVMVGVPFAALLAIYLIIQLVLDQSEQQENNGAQSSASNEFKEETLKPLLVEDFHTHAFGWEGPGGGYVNDLYRVDVEPCTTTTSSPRSPSSVVPLRSERPPYRSRRP